MIAAKFSEVFSGKGAKRNEAEVLLKTKFPSAKWYSSTAILDISEKEALTMPGICEFGEVTITKFDMDEISKAAEKYAEKLFWLNVIRKGEHKLTSLDVAKQIGESLEKKGLKASSRGTIINIEIHNDTVLVYKRTEGPGGLPSGLLGKVIVIWENNYQSQLALLKVASRGFTPLVLCPKGSNPCCGEKIEYNFQNAFENAGFSLKNMRGPLLKLFTYKLAKHLKDTIGAWFIISPEIYGVGLEGDPKLLKNIESLANTTIIRPLAFETKLNVIKQAKKFGFELKSTKSEWRRFKISELEQEWITLEFEKLLKK